MNLSTGVMPAEAGIQVTEQRGCAKNIPRSR
jgi:hypothetical protein